MIFLIILWTKSIDAKASSITYTTDKYYLPRCALDWSNVVEFDVFFPAVCLFDKGGDNYLRYDFKLTTNLPSDVVYWYTDPEFYIMGDTLNVSYRNQNNYFYVFDSGYFNPSSYGYVKVRMHLQHIGTDEITNYGSQGLSGSYYDSTYGTSGTVHMTGDISSSMLHEQYVIPSNTYYVMISNAGIMEAYPISMPKQTIEVKDTTGNTLQQQANNLQQQSNTLQQQQAELQKESNDIQKEQVETSKGIFGKISDFFAGFFDGIINAFKSLFVPDDDYFADFFSRLNEFFSDKLGALYAPVDILVDLLGMINDASDSPPGINFPGIKWGDIYIIKPQTISLLEYSEKLPELQSKIYFATDILLIGWLLWLLQIKLKEVLVE